MEEKLVKNIRTGRRLASWLLSGYLQSMLPDIDAEEEIYKKMHFSKYFQQIMMNV